MNASKGMDLIRLLFGQIDKIIYWLISITYSIIEKLANISIFNSGDIETFSKRIYVFLGVVMLFKVTFSLITYLIDPDAMSDKAKGTGNLIKNVVITLFLIIIVPYAFNLLYTAQSAIINDNLIPRLILGTTDTETTKLSVMMDPEVCDEAGKVNNYGEYISLVTLRPFIQVYDNYHNQVSKADLINILDDGEKLAYCSGGISSKLGSTVLYADTHILNIGQYIFDYSFFVSTAFGILIFLLLLNFCFDIAVRTIKLGFLEIIAPIPIISYIDPKSGKDGIFKKWYTEVINTWASLFIRLAVVYFAIYIITIVNNNSTVISDENGNIIMLFLLIGALMFAKQAIPLIEKIFGIKFNNTVQLNPFKKISDQALFGKQLVSLPGKAIAGTIGAGLAVGGHVYATRKNSADFKKKSEEALNARNEMYSKRRIRDNALRHYNTRQAQLESEERRVSMSLTPGQSPTAAQQARLDTLKARAESAKKLYDKRKLDADVAKDKAKEKNEAAIKQREKNDKFSNNHVIAAGLLQAFRGAKLGLESKDAANIAKAVTEGINAAKRSTKIKNDYDKFGILDRLKDLGTDISGIKNESGTTSMVKAAMKEQNENLNNIRNGIMALNQSLAGARPGSIIYDQKGNMSINSAFDFNPGERENLQILIENYNMLRRAEKDTTKQIKEYEDIMDNHKKDKK